eukprot:4163901-Pyramimonas_sp.AAC.2
MFSLAQSVSGRDVHSILAYGAPCRLVARCVKRRSPAHVVGSAGRRGRPIAVCGTEGTHGGRVTSKELAPPPVTEAILAHTTRRSVTGSLAAAAFMLTSPLENAYADIPVLEEPKVTHRVYFDIGVPFLPQNLSMAVLWAFVPKRCLLKLGVAGVMWLQTKPLP